MRFLIGVTAAMSLAAFNVAHAADLPQQVCRGGILADALTGRPLVCGPNREPCPCGAPVAESDLTPYYVAGALAVVGLGVGLGVGLSGGHGCTNTAVPISGGAIPICQ